MQDHAVFELPDLNRNLEQLCNDRLGLRVGQFRVLQRLGAQLLMQDICGSMFQQAHEVGQKGGA